MTCPVSHCHVQRKDFEHNDEFYHMPVYAPYSREKQHVLLSLNVPKSDMATSGRFCRECTRPDQDYAMSWIKTYGKAASSARRLGIQRSSILHRPGSSTS